MGKYINRLYILTRALDLIKLIELNIAPIIRNQWQRIISLKGYVEPL